ncbi:hypothetical protein QUA41_30680 [Microcoleus sp. Pol11C1]|uniref:hypothetical protein n=1 Tax=unclassified Microcoleus TaxID=2642155 RepID=UPI002FD3DA16
MKSAIGGVYRSRKEVLENLQISSTTLVNYCKFLTEVTPDEFQHKKFESMYSPESYAALQKIRQLFLDGWSREQVKTKLLNEGL